MHAPIALLFRRVLVLVTLALAVSVFAPAAEASDQAEQFVDANVQKGLTILNNKGLAPAQRSDQFEHFLLALTDMKRISLYTLGQYRRGASQADLDAFSAAFQNYAVAVYQSYFSRYSGQTLKVIGSSPGSAPTNEVVRTVLIDPSDRSGTPPAEVDFRVYFDKGPPVVLDFSYGGIWLAETERNDFSGFLGQNGGDLHALDSHLADLARQFRSGQPPK
jgi:phospholipid transport system substrate-binding protein